MTQPSGLPAGTELSNAQLATWDGEPSILLAFRQWGFDFAFGNGLTVPNLQQQGCQFVCRYLSGNLGHGKDVSPAEMENYFSGGISVVLNWETDGLMPNREAGVNAARAAEAEAKALGLPDSVIYFSYDTDPRGNPSAPLPYMRGVASVLGKDRTGMYGGHDAITAYFNAGIGKYGWQTYAWSNGMWDPRAQIQQWNNNVKLLRTFVDQDRTTTDDFGQNTGHGQTTGPYSHVASGLHSFGHIASGRGMDVWAWLKLQQKLNAGDAEALVRHARPRPGDRWWSNHP